MDSLGALVVGIVGVVGVLLGAGVAVALGRHSREPRGSMRPSRDRRSLDQALAASEAVSAALSEDALYLSAVLSSVDAVLVLFDRDERVRFVNERFEATFALRGADLVGRSHQQFVDQLAPLFEEAGPFRRLNAEDEPSATRSRPSGEVAADEIEVRTRGDDRRVLLYSLSTVREGDERIGRVGMFRDVTVQRAAEGARARLLAELAARATTDPLTELKNRRAMTDALDSELDRARRYDRPLSVALFDLDHFKAVNDDFGHEAGDAVLLAFARVLQGAARSSDVVARWGGEEFLVLLPEADLEGARAFADRVRAAIAAERPLAKVAAAEGRARTTTCSAGVSVLRAEDDGQSLIRRADEALYEAKRQGRDRVGVRR